MKKFLMLTRKGEWFLRDTLADLEQELRLRDPAAADFMCSFEENAKLGDAAGMWHGDVVFVRVTTAEPLTYDIADDVEESPEEFLS